MKHIKRRILPCIAVVMALFCAFSTQVFAANLPLPFLTNFMAVENIDGKEATVIGTLDFEGLSELILQKGDDPAEIFSIFLDAVQRKEYRVILTPFSSSDSLAIGFSVSGTTMHFEQWGSNSYHFDFRNSSQTIMPYYLFSFLANKDGDFLSVNGASGYGCYPAVTQELTYSDTKTRYYFPEQFKSINNIPSFYLNRQYSFTTDDIYFRDNMNLLFSQVISHSLTVNYQYADGTQAAPPHTETLEEGAAYSIPSPELDGYTADRLTVSGTMGAEDVTETVTYTRIPQPHTLTVNYQYEDSSQAADPHTETVTEGNAYSVRSPTISGYMPDKPTVSGTMGLEDVTETVTYTANAPPIVDHSLTINYIYADG